MEYWLIAFVVAFATVFTYIVMLEYGVNAGNHGLFVKILRLKKRKADAMELGNAIFNHVMTEVGRRGENWNGKYDIRPAIELIGERDFNNVYNAVAKRLLELDFQQVSLDQVNKVLIIG